MDRVSAVHNDFCSQRSCHFLANIYSTYFTHFRQGSACTPLAAVLFKLEACVRNNLNKVAVTSMLCRWNRSCKNAELALLQMINFKMIVERDQLPQPKKIVESPCFLLLCECRKLKKIYNIKKN